MKPRNLTQPEHWEEWFELCALAKCKKDAQKALSSFAYWRYKKYLMKALSEKKQSELNLPTEISDLVGAGGGSAGEEAEGVSACWHDLEASVWYSDKPKEQNKTYKKFYRAAARSKAIEQSSQDARNFLEGSVTRYLIHTRCRSILVRVLFQQPPKRDDEGNVIEELDGLLGGKEANSEPQDSPLKDSENLQLAQKIFDALEDEEKFFILASYLQINLSAESITEYFQRKKAALYERQKRIIQSLGGMLHLENEPFSHDEILSILKELHDLLEKWGKNPECPFSQCLK